MSFKTKKYQVIRQALSKELSSFIFNYMILQRDAVDWMMKNNKVNSDNPLIGLRTDLQIPGCYSKYADWVMETLLMYMIPIMKQRTGLELIPTCSYTRLYEKGDTLHRHKDRASCEVSTTLHLGGDEWPIFIDSKGVKIDLKAGDMLIYAGCELEHWREPFEGTVCLQVFLHYNHAKSPFAKTNLLDGRPIPGIPKYESIK
tara:strand:+ start:221 stop:823 length:603 start_codon:yes stop_codon:yes gene_type:complete